MHLLLKKKNDGGGEMMIYCRIFAKSSAPQEVRPSFLAVGYTKRFVVESMGEVRRSNNSNRMCCGGLVRLRVALTYGREFSENRMR